MGNALLFAYHIVGSSPEALMYRFLFPLRDGCIIAFAILDNIKDVGYWIVNICKTDFICDISYETVNR